MPRLKSDPVLGATSYRLIHNQLGPKALSHSPQEVRIDLAKGGGGVEFRNLKLLQGKREQRGTDGRVQLYKGGKRKRQLLERSTACQAWL